MRVHRCSGLVAIRSIRHSVLKRVAVIILLRDEVFHVRSKHCCKDVERNRRGHLRVTRELASIHVNAYDAQASRALQLL